MIAKGTTVRFSHPTSNGGDVRFTAKVVKVVGSQAWVEIPVRVRTMPFPPLGGKRFGFYNISDLRVAR